jgi:hypothetical protein
MRVFMTGASGFVGRALTSALVARGDSIVALSRSAREPSDKIEWVTGDAASAKDRAAGCDAIVHLAGEPVAARRWTATQKQKLVASRVEAAAILAGVRGPRTFVSASGTDYFPFDEGDRAYVESDGPGDSFLAKLCVAWEGAAARAREHGARVAFLRTPLTVGHGSEAIAKMSTPFKLFAGGPIGSGKQWIAWIHVDDLVGAYVAALDGLDGPINAVAPTCVHQKELARALGKALGRPSWLPVPTPALRLAVGELAEYLVHGRRVAPAALEKAGYAFKHPELAGALAASI